MKLYCDVRPNLGESKDAVFCVFETLRFERIWKSMQVSAVSKSNRLGSRRFFEMEVQG